MNETNDESVNGETPRFPAGPEQSAGSLEDPASLSERDVAPWDDADATHDDAKISNVAAPTRSDAVRSPASADDSLAEHAEGVPIAPAPAEAPARGRARRVALVATSGLVAVAAIGTAGFVVGHYVARPQVPSAFGNFPNFHFSHIPGGSSRGFGDFPTGPSGSSGALPANAPSTASAAKIAAKVDAGVVDIATTSKYQSSSAAGTGMVLSSNGLVLTNNHVINGATSISVRVVSSGATYSARVVGYSVNNDVALLQLNNASGLSTVTTTNSSAVSARQPVVAIGNAGGVGGTPSVAPGAVVATNQSLSAADPSTLTGVEKLSNMIQVAANIQPGDSGGPLVNVQGQVIGMDTAGSSSGAGFGSPAQSGATTQGFAIPINTALSIVHTIENATPGPSVHLGATPILGIEISPTLSGFEGANAPVAGVQIAGVAPGTPAASSALRPGDIITALNGQSVSSPQELSTIVQKYAPGDSLRVTFTTLSGASSSVNVRLIAGPAL